VLTPHEAQAEGLDMKVYWQKIEEGRRADYVRALLEERRGVETRGDDPPRLAAIDAELARMGHEATAPAKRAETHEHKGAAA
jgi:hypothetical protein